MKIRRCTHLVIEPRHAVSVDLAALLKGRASTGKQPQWVALAAHLHAGVVLDADELELVGQLSATEWSALPTDDTQRAAAGRLLSKGLVLADSADGEALRVRDEALQCTHWWPPMAVAHMHSRWQGVDSVDYMRERGLETAAGLRRALGPPPPEAQTLPGEYLALPLQEETGFDALLGGRATCRNFDTGRSLSAAMLARLLQRTVMAQARVEVDSETAFLKKNTPSGGGLHATETYLVVQRVDGLEPGLYHYHALKHGLVLLPSPPAVALGELATRMLSGQHWFAEAAALLVFAPRFERSFWKYRDHTKAYRALVLDVGHISQAVQTCATEAGLGSFVTAAVNEQDIDAALGLDGVTQGAMAVCGIGWRAERMTTTELDPKGQVWKPAEPHT